MKKHQVALIFIVALLARGLFSWATFPDAGWQGAFYGSELGRIASNLAEGRGFSSPFSEGSRPTAWFGPFMPLVWAGVFKLTGTFSDLSLQLIVGLQVLIGSCASVVYALIIHRVGAKISGLRPFWLMLLSLLVAVWPESLFLHAYPWYFAWQELAVAIVFLLGVGALLNPEKLRPVALGCATGFALLINPVPVLLFGWILFVHALLCLKQKRFPMKSYIVSGLVCLVILLPWVFRNFVSMDAFIPLRSNFPVELRQGNNPEGSVVQSVDSVHPALRADELARYQSMGEIAYADHCMEEAKLYILENPIPTLRRTAGRVYVYWMTDLTDHWGWRDTPPWWKRGAAHAGLRLVRIVSALVPLALLLILLFRGHLWKVPTKSLFFGLLLFLPLPYYLTHVVAIYPLWMKPYILMFAGLAWFASRASSTALPSNPQARHEY